MQLAGCHRRLRCLPICLACAAALACGKAPGEGRQYASLPASIPAVATAAYSRVWSNSPAGGLDENGVRFVQAAIRSEIAYFKNVIAIREKRHDEPPSIANSVNQNVDEFQAATDVELSQFKERAITDGDYRIASADARFAMASFGRPVADSIFFHTAYAVPAAPRGQVVLVFRVSREAHSVLFGRIAYLQECEEQMRGTRK